MKIRALLVLALLAAAPGMAADGGERQFQLDLDEVSLKPQDPRTQARLSRWNDDPMARVEMAMATDQARLLGGHMVGMSRPRAMVFSVRLRKGLAAALMVSLQASGVDFNERQMAVIRWPWEDDDEAKPAMPLDEQLSVLLEERLGR
jgi:hypothetical protein